jgi:ubiquinone biosynthesis protein COQ9
VRSPLASSQRERLIEAILPEVAFDGWSRHSLRRAASHCGIEAEEALALFSEGAASLVAEFSRWLDRRMEERVLRAPREGVSLGERVRRAVIARLETAAPWREAVRRAAAILALPQNAPLALTLLFESADRIWYAVGDDATDFSFYTKRLTLAAIAAATLLYWLDDRSADFADTRGFLERRLGDLAEFGKARQRLLALFAGAPNPLRLFRPYR